MLLHALHERTRHNRMTDGFELARMARQTLAEADEVTLVIHGIGRFGSVDPDGPVVVMREMTAGPRSPANPIPCWPGGPGGRPCSASPARPHR